MLLICIQWVMQDANEIFQNTFTICLNSMYSSPWENMGPETATICIEISMSSQWWCRPSNLKMYLWTQHIQRKSDQFYMSLYRMDTLGGCSDIFFLQGDDFCNFLFDFLRNQAYSFGRIWEELWEEFAPSAEESPIDKDSKNILVRVTSHANISIHHN